MLLYKNLHISEKSITFAHTKEKDKKIIVKDNSKSDNNNINKYIKSNFKYNIIIYID